MRSVARIVAVALGLAALVGCGGSRIAPTREAAAQAVFFASKGAGGASGAVLSVALSGATTFESEVACPRGGRAVVQFAEVTDPYAPMAFDLEYRGCNFDGRTALTGSVRFSLSADGTAGSATLILAMSGQVDFSGEVADSVGFDITERVDATRLDETTGNVTVTLDGWIETSSGRYVYDNEVIVITVDGIDHV